MVKGRTELPDSMRVQHEPTYRAAPSSAPAAPEWLQGLALEEWNRCVAEFDKISRLLNPIDQSVLAAYCQTFSQYREIIDLLRTQGTLIGARLNPAARHCKDLLSMLLQFSKHFGLTPGGRKSLDVKPEKETKKGSLRDFNANN